MSSLGPQPEGVSSDECNVLALGGRVQIVTRVGVMFSGPRWVENFKGTVSSLSPREGEAEAVLS